MKTFNPHSVDEQLLNPYECFTAIREKTHTQYNPTKKYWEVTDYENVQRVATEYTTFSSEERNFRRESDNRDKRESRSIIAMDPPRHNKLRALVSQAFTPRAIAQLKPRIAEITHALLDDVLERGEMDIITDLSYPLPVMVIAEMLGVPISDRARFKRWSDEIVMTEYNEASEIDFETAMRRESERLKTTFEEMDEYFRSVLAQRRAKPEQDLISALLAASVDGERLDEPELLGFCSLLLIAGNITTTNLLGNAVLCFDEHPELWDQMAADPSLIPSAIEEVLRYRPPVTILARFVKDDVVLSGQHLKHGDFVMASVACANCDPAAFEHPERFDITRKPNRHLTFGHGIHFCLGAPLARLEADIALKILLERITAIQRVPGQLETVKSTFIFGARHVPVTFNVR